MFSELLDLCSENILCTTTVWIWVLLKWKVLIWGTHRRDIDKKSWECLEKRNDEFCGNGIPSHVVMGRETLIRLCTEDVWCIVVLNFMWQINGYFITSCKKNWMILCFYSLSSVSIYCLSTSVSYKQFSDAHLLNLFKNYNSHFRLQIHLRVDLLCVCVCAYTHVCIV